MEKEDQNKITQIHVRVDKDTRNKWLMICETLKGNTQTAIFKNLVNQISATICDLYDIRGYEDKE